MSAADWVIIAVLVWCGFAALVVWWIDRKIEEARRNPAMPPDSVQPPDNE